MMDYTISERIHVWRVAETLDAVVVRVQMEYVVVNVTVIVHLIIIVMDLHVNQETEDAVITVVVNVPLVGGGRNIIGMMVIAVIQAQYGINAPIINQPVKSIFFYYLIK
jgi:hypothetical protein